MSKPLQDHINEMKAVAKSAVAMMNKDDMPGAAEGVVEDIILITVHNLRDNPEWTSDELIDKFIRQNAHSVNPLALSRKNNK